MVLTVKTAAGPRRVGRLQPRAPLPMTLHRMRGHPWAIRLWAMRLWAIANHLAGRGRARGLPLVVAGLVTS
jgi:hypothetical protein